MAPEILQSNRCCNVTCYSKTVCKLCAFVCLFILSTVTKANQRQSHATPQKTAWQCNRLMLGLNCDAFKLTCSADSRFCCALPSIQILSLLTSNAASSLALSPVPHSPQMSRVATLCLRFLNNCNMHQMTQQMCNQSNISPCVPQHAHVATGLRICPPDQQINKH